MESALTNACTIKIENFEGPFDLLFHLIEKNKMNIYDIPINDITDQYMEYLYAMQQMDLEIACEFLLMAATLLHIKSKLLLSDKKEKQEVEEDPREELILKLVEYRKYKETSESLKLQEKLWEKAIYKLPDVIEFKRENEIIDLNPDELKKTYISILERSKRKINDTSEKMTHIMQIEKVSLKSKMRQVLKRLLDSVTVKFSEIFSKKTATKLEMVTGFLAILELTKLKKIKLEQDGQFMDIYVHKLEEITKSSLGQLDIDYGGSDGDIAN